MNGKQLYKKSRLEKGKENIGPVLPQRDGRHSGDGRTQQTVQSPPWVLQEESSQNKEPAETVIDEHDLSHPS